MSGVVVIPASKRQVSFWLPIVGGGGDWLKELKGVDPEDNDDDADWPVFKYSSVIEFHVTDARGFAEENQKANKYLAFLGVYLEEDELIYTDVVVTGKDGCLLDWDRGQLILKRINSLL